MLSVHLTTPNQLQGSSRPCGTADSGTSSPLHATPASHSITLGRQQHRHGVYPGKDIGSAQYVTPECTHPSLLIALIWLTTASETCELINPGWPPGVRQRGRHTWVLTLVVERSRTEGTHLHAEPVGLGAEGWVSGGSGPTLAVEDWAWARRRGCGVWGDRGHFWSLFEWVPGWHCELSK